MTNRSNKKNYWGGGSITPGCRKLKVLQLGKFKRFNFFIKIMNLKKIKSFFNMI